MLKEITKAEVKIGLDPNFEVEYALKQLGAHEFSSEYQINKIFDTEDRYLRKNDQVFRWRQTLILVSSLVHKLTWKIPLGGSIYKLVEENEVSCTADFAEELTKGLELVLEYRKGRRKFRYKGAEVHLDNLREDGALKRGVWHHTPFLDLSYLEIEVASDYKISEIISDLHLDRRRITKTSYSGIVFRLAKIPEK